MAKPKQTWRSMDEFRDRHQKSKNPNLPTITQIVYDLHNHGLLTINSWDDYSSERAFALHWTPGKGPCFALGPWRGLFASQEPLKLVDGLPWNYQRNESELNNLRKYAITPQYMFEIAAHESDLLSLNTFTAYEWVARELKKSKLDLPDYIDAVANEDA